MKEVNLSEDTDWDQLKAKDVEQNLTLLGVTGVEDKLQENVKTHVYDYQEAGISVWMLTGD